MTKANETTTPEEIEIKSKVDQVAEIVKELQTKYPEISVVTMFGTPPKKKYFTETGFMDGTVSGASDDVLALISRAAVAIKEAYRKE